VVPVGRFNTAGFLDMKLFTLFAAHVVCVLILRVVYRRDSRGLDAGWRHSLGHQVVAFRPQPTTTCSLPV
jgi:hypothetical protein